MIDYSMDALFIEMTEDDWETPVAGNLTDEVRKKIKQRMNEIQENEKRNSKLTISKAAERGGYKTQSFFEWKNLDDMTLPTLENLLRLCYVYHRPPSYFLCEYDSYPRDAADLKEKTNLSDECLRHLMEKKDDPVFTAITSAMIMEIEEFLPLIMQLKYYHELEKEFDAHPHKKTILRIFNKHVAADTENYFGNEKLFWDEIILTIEKETLPEEYSEDTLFQDLRYFAPILTHKSDLHLVEFRRFLDRTVNRLEEHGPIPVQNAIVRSDKEKDPTKDKES